MCGSIARTKFDAVCEAVKTIHPYQTPSIMGMPIEFVNPDYEAWVFEETADAKTSSISLFTVAGSETLVEAAAVIGNFQRQVRIADGSYAPVPRSFDWPAGGGLALTEGVNRATGGCRYGPP